MMLPLVRSHERIDKKRCEWKWFHRWRLGLVPRHITFGALDLGTWMHAALAAWYGTGFKRHGELVEHFRQITEWAIDSAHASDTPTYALEEAEKLAALGEAMCLAYAKRYGRDKEINVIAAELPREFSIADSSGKIVAKHLLKPDLIFLDAQGDVWLMESKTAATIRTGHLPIDDQARAYGAMAEAAMRKTGLIDKSSTFKGILYNFIRKALPDEREMNAQGKYLNKNGTVSKRQPPPMFLRHPVTLTRAAKIKTLQRIRQETIGITLLTEALREKRIRPEMLNKTPHTSCEKFCQYFTMCVADEQGTDIRDMQRAMYRRENPYEYEENTTDIPASFEMG